MAGKKISQRLPPRVWNLPLATVELYQVAFKAYFDDIDLAVLVDEYPVMWTITKTEVEAQCASSSQIRGNPLTKVLGIFLDMVQSSLRRETL